MNVIKKTTIERYQKEFPSASKALSVWLKIARNAKWKDPEEVKLVDPKASFVGKGRVVFDIAGGKYRLIVRINYLSQSIYVYWFGTHQEYDKIDAATIGVT